MKIFELFAGIGANTKSLSNLGIKHEVVGYSEFDKYASKAFSLIHDVPEYLNYGDITKIVSEDLPDFDLLTWGFPCQDISVAGKQKGMTQGTRSGLYHEGLRILKAKMPKYSIIENVKNLVSKKFKNNFEMILKDLEELGYKNYWKVLNAKDYGIPQNRERVFIVSVYGEHKDFKWPEPFDNGLRLKDFLEHEVDEKYYIKSEKVQKLLEQLDWQNKEKVCVDMTINEPKFKDVGNCIKARYDAGIVNQKSEGIGVVEPNVLRYQRTEYGKEIRKQYENGEVEEKIGNMREPKPRTDGIANTLTNVQKDNILCVPPLPPEPKLVGGIGEINFGKQYRQGNRVYDSEKTAMALLSQPVGNAGGNSYLYVVPPTEGAGGGEKICVPCLTPDRAEKRQNGRRFKEDGEPMFTLTGQDRHGVMMVEIPQKVTIRKHQINIKELQNLLRKHKTLTNKEIAEKLNKPITMVEHWFRTDNSFSIPDADIWHKLKKLLEIQTDYFDAQITEFEEKDGVYEKGNRFYHEGGVSPTLTTGNEHKVIQVGNIVDTGNFENPQRGRIESKCKVVQKYRIRKLTPTECFRLMAFDDSDIQKCIDAGISNTQLYKMAGNSIVVKTLEEIYKNLL